MQTNTETFSMEQICDYIGISSHTLKAWYMWEKKDIANGFVKEPYLPQPNRNTFKPGKPREWTHAQLEQLMEYKLTHPRGRSGIHGRYTVRKKENTNGE